MEKEHASLDEIPIITKKRFIAQIFVVRDPSCPNCNEHLDFSIFEDFNGTGYDWLQWKCSNGCGYFRNVELI
ncbi:MAG: hypothetical protein ACFFCS_05810 [Candidatus Hodarchaeota archaeon]